MDMGFFLGKILGTMLNYYVHPLSLVLEYTPEKEKDVLGISCYKKNPETKNCIKV